MKVQIKISFYIVGELLDRVHEGEQVKIFIKVLDNLGYDVFLFRKVIKSLSELKNIVDKIEEKFNKRFVGSSLYIDVESYVDVVNIVKFIKGLLGVDYVNVQISFDVVRDMDLQDIFGFVLSYH